MTASVRPYVDRPVGDRDRAFGAASRLARDHQLDQPVLLRHGMNSLYTCGDVVVRVGAATAPANRSHAIARWLLDAGVPTVAPVDSLAADIDGLAVTGWERIEETSAPIDWAAIGRAVRTVHQLSIDDVPAGYPIADPLGFPWWDFEAVLTDVAAEIDETALAGLQATLDRDTRWRDQVAETAVLSHGDVHPGNVLVSVDGPLLIDWDLMCIANPAWDHAMLTTYADRWGGDPAVYDAFVAGYGDPPVDATLAARFGELRNVSATLMRVKAGRTDRSAAQEAERRLRYWRSDPAAPTWQAQ